MALVLGAPGCGGDGDAAADGDPVAWERASGALRAPDLRVELTTDPCHLPIRAARVREDERAVELTLIGPDLDPERACIQIAVRRCVTVRLEHPLGTRTVVDGARGGRPPQADRPSPVAGPCPRVPRV